MTFKLRLLRLFVTVLLVGALHHFSVATAQTFPQPAVVKTGNWPLAISAVNLTNAPAALPGLCYADPAPVGATFASVHCFNNQAGALSASSLHVGLVAAFADTYAFADVNEDGRLDVLNFCTVHIGSASSSQLCVHFGDGAGGTQGSVPESTFSASQQIPNWTVLGTAKFTSSGHVDAYAVDSVNEVLVVATGDGTGFFTPTASTSLAADGTGPVIAGDFDRDGKTDILVLGNISNVITPYYGNGNGTFRPGPAFSLSGGIFSMLVQDINGDGLADLLVEGTNGTLWFFPGTSSGFSHTAVPLLGAQYGATGNGGHLVAVADLNGDGVPDIITSTPAGISVLLGDRNRNYTLGGIYNAGPGQSSYALADFDGDGHLDLAVGSPEGIAILYGNADGSFRTSRAFAAGQPAMSGAVGIFTGSGNVDAVVATSDTQGQFLVGAGDGTFAYAGSPTAPVPTTTTAATPGLWSNLQVADFDGDGRLDLVFTADGTFQAPMHAPVNTANPCSLPNLLYGNATVADFDGDGILQLLNRDVGGLRIASSHTGQVPYFLGKTVRDSDCNQLHEYAVPGRFTGQQLPDVISQHLGSLVLYPNDGTGSLDTPLGDLAVDGSLTTPGQLTAPVLSATYGGTLTTSSGGLGFPAAIGSMVVADLDADGNPDLLVTYANLSADPRAPSAAAPNYLYIWFSSGGGKFLTSAKHPVNPVRITLSRNYYRVITADLNGDGFPDLILSDGQLVSVQFGRGDGTFGPEEHFLGGQGINSISVADVNRDGRLDLVVANGGAVLTNPVVNHEALAVNAGVNTGGITVLLNQSLATLAGTVSANPEPSGYGHDFSLTATFSGIVSGGPAPTRPVTFAVDGTTLGTATISGNSASYTVSSPSYAVGSHTITATYAGDVNYSSLALSGIHAISALPSTTYLTNLLTPIHYGEIIGDIAVAHADPANPTVDFESTVGGTINVFIDGLNVCVLPVIGSSNSCPSTTGAGYPAGTHIISLMYTGNQYFGPSTSPAYTVLVLADDTVTALSSSNNPSFLGTPVTFTANVSSASATPSGSVTFFDGTTSLGTFPLNSSGSANVTTSNLVIGTHQITARFGSTQNFNASASLPLAQVIVQPAVASVTVLASSANPSYVGQNVTFTATVSTAITVAGALTGSVNFTDGATVIATVPLGAGGAASYSTSTLTLGSHIITAAFAGSAAATPSVSTQLVQVVGLSGFSLIVNPSALSVPIGNSVSVQVTVTEFGSFTQPVSLSCSGLVSEASCTFASDTIPAGGGVTQLIVKAAAPHDCENNTPYFVTSGSSAGIGVMATGLLILLVQRRRRFLQGIALVVLLGLLPAVAGCGHCTDLGVRPGTYSFTVSGTSTGSPVTTVSQTLKMVAHL